MKWHLKDRELEKKLIAIDPNFVSRLDKTTKTILKFQEKGFILHGDARINVWYKDDVLFSLGCSITELEEVEDYNSNAWNDYPKVTPPEGVVMRVESVCGNCSYKKCAIFDEDTWKNERDGKPTGLVLGKVKRFRPWSED